MDMYWKEETPVKSASLVFSEEFNWASRIEEIGKRNQEKG
jgi:hypothetical protein